MFTDEQLSRVLTLAREIGLGVGSREFEASLNPAPVQPSRRRHTRSWNRTTRPRPRAATVTMFGSSPIESDPDLAALVDELDLRNDPELLADIRAAYQAGYEQAICDKLDTFVRGHLTT
jgi:hypothetical protein